MSACCCQYDLEKFNSSMLHCTIYQPAWLLAHLLGEPYTGSRSRRSCGTVARWSSSLRDRIRFHFIYINFCSVWSKRCCAVIVSPALMYSHTWARTQSHVHAVTRIPCHGTRGGLLRLQGSACHFSNEIIILGARPTPLLLLRSPVIHDQTIHQNQTAQSLFSFLFLLFLNTHKLLVVNEMANKPPEAASAWKYLSSPKSCQNKQSWCYRENRKLNAVHLWVFYFFFFPQLKLWHERIFFFFGFLFYFLHM